MKDLKLEAEKVLWKDRKRFLRLPLSFTRYRLTASRLIVTKGLFNTHEEEILLYRILDINLTKKFSQRLFGMGTITLFTADRSSSQIQLVNIVNSDKVKQVFSKLVEEDRVRKGHLAREMYGTGFSGEKERYTDVDGDGIPDFLDNDVNR
ncbi:MAG: PH domain-containing protein [Erysipelothrix sp.]|nr:PH domain-containing protein [Erysipelothrix sp.]